jgi:large subunit ribosomal protein L31
MKKEIHPEYRPVVFHDVAADFKMVVRSTAETKDKIQLDGKEYPVVKFEISSASHPFFTGQQKYVDTLGRVERFQKKFGGDYFAKPAAKKGTKGKG